jgi:predicted enzyme related to lactoylglutathione lyase
MPISVLLKSRDLEATKSFYAEMLGFEVIDSGEATCTVQKEDCSIIFTTEELWSDHPKCTGTIYLFIDDVDAYYESIKEKAIVLWPLQDMPYGTREFGIKDYDEYHIAFAQKA